MRVTNLTTFENNVPVRLGFTWDGIDQLVAYSGDEIIARLPIENIPFGVLLRPIMSFVNAVNIAAVFDVDYILAATER